MCTLYIMMWNTIQQKEMFSFYGKSNNIQIVGYTKIKSKS